MLKNVFYIVFILETKTCATFSDAEKIFQIWVKYYPTVSKDKMYWNKMWINIQLLKFIRENSRFELS